jgi:solute:Na+ symporter, SSS family
MSPLDWGVLATTLLAFVLYGIWRSRGERNLSDYLLAGRSMRWPMVALSVMATQASAVTFLSTPGQGYADGLRFVQFYFGLPLAMIAICVIALPVYSRLKVFTAYEYLEQRFDGKTRTLAAALFLIQRGLAAGITLYAPALVLSVILGWDIRLTVALLGVLAVIYTASGGSKAVSYTQALQFTIILGTMALAAFLVLRALPRGVSIADASAIAGSLGRLNALNLRFDPNDRYTLWSGLIGGFFLQLSYFGTDQSQVGRYLTGRSLSASRLGLVFNGLVKIPMQLAILSLGVLVFVLSVFGRPPLHFDPATSARLANGAHAAEWSALEVRQRGVVETRVRDAQAVVAARHAGDAGATDAALARLRDDQTELDGIRRDTGALISRAAPGAPTNDTNFIFLRFVLSTLPAGVIGLVFAAVFAASMNASAAELNALASTTVVDVWKRLAPGGTEPRRELMVSRLVTVGWAVFAVLFGTVASRLGSLIEAVNVLGSLFYGTILGIFLTAFLLRRVAGTAVFVAALIAEAAVLTCFKFTGISFLWYNLIGCVLVMAVSLGLTVLRPPRATRAATV